MVHSERPLLLWRFTGQSWATLRDLLKSFAWKFKLKPSVVFPALTPWHVLYELLYQNYHLGQLLVPDKLRPILDKISLHQWKLELLIFHYTYADTWFREACQPMYTRLINPRRWVWLASLKHTIDTFVVYLCKKLILKSMSSHVYHVDTSTKVNLHCIVKT